MGRELGLRPGMCSSYGFQGPVSDLHVRFRSAFNCLWLRSCRFDSGSFIELTVITSPRMDDALQLEGPASLEITLPCTGAGLWIRGFYMPNGPYYGFQSPEIG